MTTIRPIDIVTPIRAGSFRIKEAQLTGRGPLFVRHLRTMLSRSWTPVLPIFCWLIDHPEGTFLVDTGPRQSRAWRYPRYHLYYPLAYRARVDPTEGIGNGLDDLGLTVDDIDTVVLTHLHPDHAEGLELVPGIEVTVDEGEYRYASSLRGRFWGLHPSLRPAAERTDVVTMDGGSVGPFERSHELANGVSMVPTPGHTPHHRSVVVEGDGPTVLLAADACMQIDQLDTGRIDGVTVDTAGARDTIERIGRWQRETELIVLPSHDPRGVEYLTEARG